MRTAAWLLIALTGADALCASRASGAAAPVSEQTNLLFYAPWEGSTQAKSARGAAGPATESGILFARGKIGRGVVIGQGARLSYWTQGNLNPAAGTILMWAKPDWSAGDPIEFTSLGFLDAGNHRGNNSGIYLHYQRESAALAITFDFSAQAAAGFRGAPLDWRAGQWHHIAVAWDARRGIDLYVDGSRHLRKRLTWRPAYVQPAMAVGSGYTFANSVRGVLDELYIYDRRLTQQEVQEVMESSDGPPRIAWRPTTVQAARPLRIAYNRKQPAPFRFSSTVQCRARVRDWNGDGKPDLIDADTAFGPTEILIALNVGTRREPRFHVDQMALAPINRASEAELYYGFDVTDWNGDGLLDFLSGGIILHLNLGPRENPQFQYVGPVLIGGKPFPYQCKYTTATFADLDGDGRRDLLISTHAPEPGVDPSDAVRQAYAACVEPGWDVARSPWPKTRLLFCKNVGTDTEPRFETLEEVQVNGVPAAEFIHIWAMPEVVDWSGDGYGDLIVGDCSRSIRFFRNLRGNGTPAFEADLLPLEEGVERLQPDHVPSVMHEYDRPVMKIPQHVNDYISIELPSAWLQPNAVDWDGDGDLDLVIAGNDHAVWVMENVGSNEHPLFAEPRPILYEEDASPSAPLGIDNVAVPQIVDWDGDGKPDIVAGGEQGHIHFFRNVGAPGKWEFETPVRLKDQSGRDVWLADICDGYFHGIWHPGTPMSSSDFFGYAETTVVDLDGDGDLDILCGDISRHLRVIENVGTRREPLLRPPYPVKLDGKLYVGGWRSRPGALDIDGDGKVEVVHPASDGIYHIYRIVQGEGELLLADDRVLLDHDGQPMRIAGHGDRQHIRIVDWDEDGLYSLVIGYIGGRVILARNVATNAEPRFELSNLLPEIRPLHDFGVDAWDWYGNGHKDLIVSSECGWLYVYDRRMLTEE